MDRRRFDESIVIGILSGGIVSILSNAVQLNFIAEAGGLASVIFALCYAIYVKYRNKTSSPDSTSNKKEKSQPNNPSSSPNIDPEGTIAEKLEALKNLIPEDMGLLRAKEFFQKINAQMDLTTSLFGQQHKDIMEISKSSSRLGKLTYVLIGFTIVLIVVASISLILTWNQRDIMDKQFRSENIPPKIPKLIAGDVPIQNGTYRGYPLVEKLSISTASTHMLDVKIQNITFADFPSGNFTIPSEIVFSPIEKYIGAGVSNLDFDIPFYLTFDEKNLAPYDRDTVWAGIPITTQVQISDLQNSSSTPQNFILHSYLSIKGEYLPKKVTDAPSFTDTVTVTKNKSIK